MTCGSTQFQPFVRMVLLSRQIRGKGGSVEDAGLGGGVVVTRGSVVVAALDEKRYC